jgi:hypothetical protein
MSAYRSLVWRHNNQEKRTIQKKIYRTRKRLRTLGILPPVDVDMNEEQQKIYDQLGEGDFSYWDKIKIRDGHDGGNQTYQRRHWTPEILLYERYRYTTSVKGSTFDITPEDIAIPERCPLIDIPISVDYEDRKSDNYYVLDRLDWSKGIVKGNIRVVSILGLHQRLKEISKLDSFSYEDYVPDDLQKEICSRARKNARRRGLEYNLEHGDIVIPETCPYLKIKLSYNKKDSREPFYYSVDRMDSSKGYVKGNVQIISFLSNTMKSEASTDQLLTFAKSVLEIHKKS